jgi:hypothetical protein
LFKRSNYINEETLHMNQLIFRNDEFSNQLIFRNNEFSNQLKNDKRESDEQSAILSSMKKISRVFLFSKIFDELRNDLINTQNSRSIISSAHVKLIVRIRTLSSSSIEVFVFVINNIFQK